MKKITHHFGLLLCSLILGVNVHAQTFQSLSQTIQYWVGEGPDSAAVVVTFNSSDFDSSFVWGVKFNNAITGRDALDSIQLYDQNFSWFPDGIFLDSIKYGHRSGKNATLGYYWGINDLVNDEWTYGSGLESSLQNQAVIGFSFTNFNPEVKPGLPIPALNPNYLSFDTSTFFYRIGTGNKRAYLVVDFDPSSPGKSFAFAINFEETITGLDLLETVATNFDSFRFVGDAFLSDVYYKQDSALGGQPYFWGTWSATNYGLWTLNNGLSQVVEDESFFACTYTSFAPAQRPQYAQIQLPPPFGNVTVVQKPIALSVFPNPCNQQVVIQTMGTDQKMIVVFDMLGNEVFKGTMEEQFQLQTAAWKPGSYVVKLSNERVVAVQRLIKY